VDAAEFGAEDRELIHIALVRSPSLFRVAVMGVRAAGREHHTAVPQPPGLALDARQPSAVVDDQVAASVFAERDVGCPTLRVQRQHDRQGGPVADGLRMLHLAMMLEVSDALYAHKTTETRLQCPFLPE